VGVGPGTGEDDVLRGAGTGISSDLLALRGTIAGTSNGSFGLEGLQGGMGLSPPLSAGGVGLFPDDVLARGLGGVTSFWLFCWRI
jgi:hypothetical protein